MICALLRAARRSAASLRRIVVPAVVIYAFVAFAALMARVRCTVRCLCELVQLQHSESTSSQWSHVCCVASSGMAAWLWLRLRAKSQLSLRLQVAGAWRFGGSAEAHAEAANSKTRGRRGVPRMQYGSRGFRSELNTATRASVLRHTSLASRLAFGFNRSGRAPHVLAAS